MTDNVQCFHVLPTATQPHQPGVWDHGDGSFTVYPHLRSETVEEDRDVCEQYDRPRFHVTPPDKGKNQVAGVHFRGFDRDLCRNRYAAEQLARGLEAAISLARWLDCAAYGGDWPWLETEGQE